MPHKFHSHKFKELVRDKDEFGYNVLLSDKGDAHKTIMGGFLTILMNSMFLAIFVKKFVSMYTFENSNINQS